MELDRKKGMFDWEKIEKDVVAAIRTLADLDKRLPEGPAGNAIFARIIVPSVGLLLNFKKSVRVERVDDNNQDIHH